ncbi:MAG: hypothetical protein EFT35_08175 [Methanophagales archaeon ANME-1-THS]|nr:MAG: hypothetical protein EFT35_08175 [Methanophagales archaeon ANME-1-THS]
MDNGQVCVDFLISITIIAFGIVVLLSQIPMLFAPFQTVAMDIQPVAYRTSIILVEDGGIYELEDNITSKWEDPEGNTWNYTENRNLLTNYHGNVKRIGLAMSTSSLGWSSSSEDIVPNNLSKDKIDALQAWWKDGNSSTEGNSSLIIQKLGLYVTYNTLPLNYHYNISLRDFNDNLLHMDGSPVLEIGDSIPGTDKRYANATRMTVEKIERIVAIDDPPPTCEKIGDVQCAKLVVCIWR